MMESTY